MESRIPVPTDNIFKFYALFGLLLFVFACGALIYVTQSTNELVFTSYVELETLKEQKTPSPSVVAKIAMFERLLEIGLQSKEMYRYVIAFFSGIGFWLSVYGFWQWHRRIQPVIDEMQRVQLELAKLQLVKLQSEQPNQGVGGA
ncbi:hypothetical protein [Pseudomonas sp. EA_35y_Pfl2_R5]|uniref:hypothetical protein n=1 Tax=Pseudomonas sp. EA_35y_Pfl2_R5 TaxID=3088690 RepID=UPI0030DAECE2